MGLSKPISRLEQEEPPITTKPYRDDPEAPAHDDFGSSSTSPVSELEMRPVSNGRRKRRRRRAPPADASSGNGCSCGAKLSWFIVILMICAYAVSRYDASSNEKVKQNISSTNEADNIPSTNVADAVNQTAATNPIIKGSKSKKGHHKSSSICSRKIPFDLNDTSTWPTPYTPSYYTEEPEPVKYKSILLLKREDELDNQSHRIRSINEFFSALDMAYELNYELYITKDANWLWDAFIPPFLGDKVERNDDLWIKLQDTLDVKIIENEEEAMANFHEMSLFSPKNLYEAKTLTVEQLRNRRDTIFRKLLRMSPSTATGDVCGTITLCGLTNVNSYHYSAAYVVIDLSPSVSKNWQAKFNEISGKDHSASYQMTPEYVKSILKPLRLHSKLIYIMGDYSAEEDEEIKRLMNDPELNTAQAVEESDDYDHSDMLHLAVLADVYMADPTSQWSLMIARMRFALGLENTFVLTEEVVGEDGVKQWRSYVDEENYLELYDREHLGPWMG